MFILYTDISCLFRWIRHQKPWGLQPPPASLRTARLLGLLEEQNLLSSDVSELMTSMRHYAEKQRLPMMRTYNGDF